MTLILIVMAGATAAAAILTWRLVNIVKREGASSLLSTQKAGGTMRHICLLFTWGLLMREGLAALLDAAPSETMAGFGAMFGGLLALCLIDARKQPASETIKTRRG